MRILTPFLVTLAVTGLAVVLVVRDARAARVRSDAWAWSNATGCVPSGWHPLWSWPGTGHLTVGPRRISVRVVPAEVPPVAAVTAGPAPDLGAVTGDVVHVVTAIPTRTSRSARVVPVTGWAHPEGLDWPPSTRCEREPVVGGVCHRCTLRRGHPGGCVPGGAS